MGREPAPRDVDPEIEVHARDVPTELLLRAAAAAVAVVVAFAAIGVRLWYLQVVRGAEMRTVSENNRTRLVRVPAARGVVYDRNGEILIDNRPSFNVVFVPEDARGSREVLGNLSHRLGSPRESIDKAIHAPSKRPPYEGIVVRRDVEWNDVVALETNQLELPGVSLQVAPKRYYPFGPLAAHVLGYVGEVSERELADGATKNLRRGDLVGKASLERSWDDELRGNGGGEQVEVDAVGRRMRVLEQMPDVPGDNLTLTIDRDLQEAAEQAMGDHEGSVVAIDPRNGEILAMVSRPSYDPNVFARGIRGDEWRALIDAPTHPLNNRAIQGQYPPGSTFKIAMAVAALDAGVITPSTPFRCGGGMQFGNHYFRCWKRGGHGTMRLHEAIVHSCDVFFYQVGQRLGVDRIADYAHRFGLGLTSGIRLEHEKAGIIPSTEWKQKRFKQPWFPGETISVAIGQGYVTTTPLQMAQLAAMVANGGVRYRPHYVKRVESPDGTLVHEVGPEILGDTQVPPEIFAAVREAMHDTVDRGTGTRAKVKGVTIGGKTGTAQAVGGDNKGKRDARRRRDHAWFIAFAPVEGAEIAIAVLVEHAGEHGGTVAAPVAQKVFERYFSRGAGPVPATPVQEADASR